MIPRNQIHRFCIVIVYRFQFILAKLISQWIYFQEKYDLYALLFWGKEIYLRQPVFRRDLNVALIHFQIYAINMFLSNHCKKNFRDVWVWIKRICMQCFMEWMWQFCVFKLFIHVSCGTLLEYMVHCTFRGIFTSLFSLEFYVSITMQFAKVI